MRLYHNLQSMDLFRRYSENLKTQSTAFGRVSSGVKVQTSKDDPNAMAESQKLKLQVRGLQMASRNMQDGMSMLQTADSSMQNIGDSVQRIRELMVQSGGANSDEEKKIIQNEIDQMLDHINKVAEYTETNGVKLLSGSNNATSKTSIQVGAMAGESLDIPMYNLTTTGLGIADVKTTDIDNSLVKLDGAVDAIEKYRAKYGAISNRLESTYNNTTDMSTRIEGAESELTGADIALEMMEYTKASVLVEAGIAMMTQTNKFPQDVLRILENVKSR